MAAHAEGGPGEPWNGCYTVGGWNWKSEDDGWARLGRDRSRVYDIFEWTGFTAMIWFRCER